MGYGNHETTMDFAFFFVQNNSGGTDAGDWNHTDFTDDFLPSFSHPCSSA